MLTDGLEKQVITGTIKDEVALLCQRDAISFKRETNPARDELVNVIENCSSLLNYPSTPVGSYLGVEHRSIDHE
jgi:hypothetical protein